MSNRKSTKSIISEAIKATQQSMARDNVQNTSVDIYKSDTRKDGPSIISVSDLQDSKTQKIRDKLSDWKYNDFAMYFLKEFYSKTDSSQKIRKLGMTLHMSAIRRAVAELLGFCDNVVLKDYIDFFMAEWLIYYQKKDNKFYVQQLWDNKVIVDFISKYDYSKSLLKRFPPSPDQDEEKNVLSDLEVQYLSGGTNMLIEYGIVIPLNWLIRFKKYSRTDACDYLVSILQGASENIFQNIVDKTISLSPYPIIFQEKEYRNILKAINKTLTVNVKFDQNEYFKWQ